MLDLNKTETAYELFLFFVFYTKICTHYSHYDIVLSNVHVNDLKIAITKLALIIYDQCLTIT